MYRSYPPESFANSAFPSRAIVRPRANRPRCATIDDDGRDVDGRDEDDVDDADVDGRPHRLDVAHADDDIARDDDIDIVVVALPRTRAFNRASASRARAINQSIIHQNQSRHRRAIFKSARDILCAAARDGGTD
jgi:hypothetical protein